MIKISTWNVNSVKARINHILNWLEEEKPDIVLLQELKCTTDSFPYEEIEDLGYNVAVNGQKSYNGVAILSKFPLTDIVTNFPNNPIEDEARYIEAWVNFPTCAVMVSSVYVPNGQSIDSAKYPIKLEFLKNLTEYYKSLVNKSEAIVVGGDFNISLTEKDVYNSSLLDEGILFSTKEKQQLRKFLSIGLIDLYRMIHPESSEESYTWWDYRSGSYNKNHGMRIDYLFASPEAAQLVSECILSKHWREKEKASDHIPVSTILNI